MRIRILLLAATTHHGARQTGARRVDGLDAQDSAEFPARPVTPSTSRTASALGPGERRAALGGLVGVGGFVAAWAIRGATRGGYSAVDDAISQLAASGAPSRNWMTAGFVAFGLGVPVYAVALRRALPGPAWMTAVATGLCTLAVAAAPLGTADAAHNLAAAAGYATLAATPLLAARQFRAQGDRGWASWSLAAGIGSAVALIASTSDASHGLFQRLGLGFTDIWIIATALTMWRTGRLGSTPRE